MDTLKAQALARIKASPELPSPPRSAARIIQLAQADDVSLNEIEQTIRTDPAFVARLVKLSNSVGSAAGGRPVVAVKDALLVLGLPAVRALALGFSLLDTYRTGRCPRFDFELFWSRSLAVASAFQAIAEQTRIAPPDEAFSVGLLANIGQLALAAVFPEDFGEILAPAGSDPQPSLLERERTRFGFNQWELGAELMSDWGLPRIYAEPVRLQASTAGEPPAVGSRPYMLTHALAMAETVAEIVLLPAQRTPQRAAELYRRGARVSLESAEVIAIGRRVVQDWEQWARLLGLRTGDAVDFSWLEQATDTRVPAPPPAREGAGLRVMLVDGEAAQRQVLHATLEHAGFAVVEVETAEEALAVAADDAPDIVVTDWVMPGMDGIEMIRRLRRLPAGDAMYILVITARTDEDHLVQAFEAGTDDFTAKPVKPRVLLARLQAAERIIRLQREAGRHYEELRNIAAELSASNRRLQELSVTDVLTGCPNRRYAMERLQQEWSAAGRRETPLSCLIIDIDWFKQINDEYGHDQGDEVLKTIAATLRAGVRAQDVVCRVGGDEFWVICPDADKEAATACAERLCAAVDGLDIRGGEIRCGISVGAAERLTGMAGPQALIEAADRNLYRAKRNGRGRVVGVDPDSGRSR